VLVTVCNVARIARLREQKLVLACQIDSSIFPPLLVFCVPRSNFLREIIRCCAPIVLLSPMPDGPGANEWPVRS
jgi:hypothetical protein